MRCTAFCGLTGDFGERNAFVEGGIFGSALVVVSDLEIFETEKP